MVTGIGLESATHNEIAISRITNNTIGVDVDKDSQANTFFMNYFDNPVDVSSVSDDVTWSSLPWLYQYVLNCSATAFASSMSFWLKFSFSGDIRPKTFSPPIARLDSAAMVPLSIPPESPSTMPFAPAFSTYSLMKRQILV